MRTRHTWIAIALALCLAAPVAWGEPKQAPDEPESAADQSGTASSSSESPPILIAAMPVFVPPNRGSPMARLGGATRSAGNDALPRIEALVPQESGWTLREDPTLYWYISKPSDVRLEFVVLQLDPMQTLVDTTLPAPETAGVQRIRLSDHGVKLTQGASYQWLVKLVPDPDDRSYDRIVGGGIERVESSPELTALLADPQTSDAHELAKGGIWYDAVDLLSTRIEAEPGNRTLWNQRAALFEQVGLPELPLEDGSAPGLERR